MHEIWVTYGKTDSMDDLQIVSWDHKPTREEGDDMYRKLYPEEFEKVGFVDWYSMKLISVTDVVG